MLYYYKSLTLFILALSLSLISFSQKKIEHAVYFGLNKSSLSKADKVSLDSITSIIKSLKNYKIKIEGYTDENGTKKYNARLATERAKVIYEYLIQNGINTLTFVSVGKGENLLPKDLADFQKRKSIISIEIENNPTYSFYGLNGTEVISEENMPLNIVEYFSTKSMLKDSMYAIDENGNILETGGMLSICKNYNQLDNSGKYYIVKIPSRGLTNDKNMTVWLQVKNKLGQLRWQSTSIKLVYDSTTQLFSFKIPVGTQNCININLDRPCGVINQTSLVYISTYKSFNFSDIIIRDNYSKLSFSAKLNDTLYVFIKRNIDNTKNMEFAGNPIINGQDSLLTIDLDNCIYTLDSNQNEHYYLCENCFDKKISPVKPPEVSPEVKPKSEPVKKQKGFFSWFTNLFRRKNK